MASSAEKIFTIPPGQSFQKTTDLLASEGIINHPFKFKILAKYKDLDRRLRAGEYLIKTPVSPSAVLNLLVSGTVRLHKLTIPEGYNLFQIADLVAKTGFGKRDDFLSAATDIDFVRKSNIPADTFEGYLFPDTYLFPKKATIETIITAMHNRFRDVFSPQWEARGSEIGLTVHQTVTLASIIEKETGTPSERALISSVFHNRLKRGMRLETDPTVIYGLDDFDGNLTRKHLKTPTPYNTYLIKGLPPGPIANPGQASLYAALYPADTNFIYFVSKKDKTHHFSANYNEHNQAVRKYQLNR